MTRTRSLLALARRFYRDENAATAVEYAMIAVGVAAAVAGTVHALGNDLKTSFFEKVAEIL